MKIEREDIPTQTIEQFAEQHDLIMEIRERPVNVGNSGRYYAHFKRAEIKDDCILRGAYGDGATPEEAIAAYRNEISLKRLVIDAFAPTRREIRVPRLVPSR